MNTTSRKILPFVLIVIVIVLINVASTTLFVQGDLTKNHVYSLSEASKRAVSSLEEPLTIKAFFSPNLPAPYNNNLQILRDLLDEYAVAGNRFFNYDIVTVPSRENAQGDTTPEEEEARRYRVYPIQIQNVQQDQVQLVTVYMGLAIIHGDMLENIPAITSTSDLEYRITSLIDDMSDKITALLSMRENIDVTLVLTKNLEAFSDAFRTMPDDLKAAVDGMNAEFYGRLSFHRIDPSDGDSENVEERYGATPLSLRNEAGQTERAYATLSVSLADRNYPIDILTRGIFGLQIADIDSLKQNISDVADSLIGVQQEIGYITGFGTPPLTSGQQQNPASTDIDLSNFDTVVSTEYQFREIDLDSERIPEGLSTLLIVSPMDHLSDYALYQIDQFLLAGNNVVMFLDSHSMIASQQSQFGGQQPTYIPRDTGLEDMIKHYGLELEKSYILDEKSFVQRQRSAQGGIVETQVYFAPIIGEGGRNNSLAFMRGLPDMVVVNASPVRPVEAADGNGQDVTATELFGSSEKGWVMSDGDINLTNPYLISPPPADMEERIPMAYQLEGTFSSYFSGQAIPERPQAAEGEQTENTLDSESIGVEQSRLDSGKGRLIVIGGASMLGSNVIDADGQTGNASFVLNLFDYLAGREDYAVMRTKGASYEPLEDTTVQLRSFIKTFNIAGLPILVILAGVGVWFSRNSRKRTIEARFSGPKEEA